MYKYLFIRVYIYICFPVWIGVSFNVYENIGVIKSGGVEIRDVRSVLVSVRKELEQNFDLESYVFVPFMPEEVSSNL